jgi:GYF domain 2
MADLWYYTHEGRPMQPVATAEIERLARAGLVKRTDMVWREGMPEWLPASEIPQIFAPSAVLEQAQTASGPDPLLASPGVSADQPGVQRGEPILLELPDERPSRPADASRPRKRRWDGQGEPDIALRAPRRDRRQQMIVLWIGLLIGGGLVLLVFVMGLLYITLSAL